MFILSFFSLLERIIFDPKQSNMCCLQPCFSLWASSQSWYNHGSDGLNNAPCKTWAKLNTNETQLVIQKA